MAAKLTKDALASEISAINALIASLDDDDIISRKSLEYKRDEVQDRMNVLSREVDTIGRVILSFEGGPVTGSHGIDASFAAKTLDDYQDLIAKEVAAQETQMARTGPVPSRNLAKLNITNIIHGSFGFELEEADSDQLRIVESPVRMAIASVDSTLLAFASGSEETFQSALAKVDRRVFLSIQSFYENMYRDSASIKIYESEREITIDHYAVLRARYRIADVEVSDEMISLQGELLGLTPISRRFDLMVIESDRLEHGRIISGQVGQRLSSDYLERLHGLSRIAGQKYQAKLALRTASRIDGSSTESFILHDLESLDNRLLEEPRR